MDATKEFMEAASTIPDPSSDDAELEIRATEMVDELKVYAEKPEVMEKSDIACPAQKGNRAAAHAKGFAKQWKAGIQQVSADTAQQQMAADEETLRLDQIGNDSDAMPELLTCEQEGMQPAVG